jgi:hypothetical protein
MKKHLFGLAVFSFIFAAFALTSAFFYAPPIPQVAEIEENYAAAHRIVSYEKTSCFRSSRKKLSAEVINSQYFFDQDKIISEVKLVWRGSGIPPEKVYLTTIVSGSEDKPSAAFGGVYQVLEAPFQSGREKTFTVISRESGNIKIKKQDNLYVVTAVSEFSGVETGAINKSVYNDKSFSEAKEVVFVHGESSIIGK